MPLTIPQIVTTDFDNRFAAIELLELYKGSAEYYKVIYGEPCIRDDNVHY